ncbi:MAG TPA: DNA polymerase IV [Lentisphaeria bacterium]|nr:MAG: DNA polymerase IV [Lentisphaerae bacterium GWF2_50_93]HCE42879.1 DNA polymerase IV [Lentisphaeria bacterium]
MDRTILHCDLNGFYAAVECLHRPELKDVPMAVGGDVEKRHGIILAKNELAKKFGVTTAETVWQARQKCPGLVLVPPRHDEYDKYSKFVNQLYERFTPLVEPFGIDESWLDVTGTMHIFGDGQKIADTIRAAVKTELGLSVSVGVSFTKVFAKLGSDYKKPDATTVISRDNYKTIVFPLPVTDLLFVGEAAATVLARLGIATIGQLAASDRKLIMDKLGKMGGVLHDYANGIDDELVRSADDARQAKSIGNGMTFKRDLVGIDDIRTGVMSLADTVAARLRCEGLRCNTVQVMIKDPQFKSISRQRKLDSPTHLAAEIGGAAIELIRSAWDMKAKIRTITVTGADLVAEDDSGQMSLFADAHDTRREKNEKIERAMDNIRGRFGKGAISSGATVKNNLGIGQDDKG